MGGETFRQQMRGFDRNASLFRRLGSSAFRLVALFTLDNSTLLLGSLNRGLCDRISK